MLKNNPQVKFVSVMGVDLGGNTTDAKIPIEIFLTDMEGFLKNGVQTDGSSVVLPEIATLGDAKVDLLPDTESSWFVDYNYDNPYDEKRYVGTLRIPAFLVHNGNFVDSRSILKRSLNFFEEKVREALKEHPHLLTNIGIDDASNIEEFLFTAATELEFWVKTPEDSEDIEKLSTSQNLKEQYWKRTQGTVRTALEKTIELMGKYGIEPEMGHKEVGGINSTIGINGKQNHVVEQLEIDWKYSDALQAGDNEILVRELVYDTFTSFGLEVTFAAKPIADVAGSGEHTHMGVAVKLNNGKIINLFSPKEMDNDYLSLIGYGGLLGLLKNYEAINPFVTSSTDAFNRLKPGFEAPVCTVASLGNDVKTPSRNRSILVGLIRDLTNPMATRFELRSPNPLSNTYLVMASSYQGMLDGILATMHIEDPQTLENEISKSAQTEGIYLEQNRQYRCEQDIFHDFSAHERSNLFGKTPETVWDNFHFFQQNEEKQATLLNGNVFTKALISSYKTATLDRWKEELLHRIIPSNMEVVREFVKSHNIEGSTDLDVVRWEKILKLRSYLVKDSLEQSSLFTRLRDALNDGQLDKASELQKEMNCIMSELRNLYSSYKRNLI
ncbi:glutamine synthetase [Proteinivorax hydrogeniformans]|uniref:glutamine synthetase n=2 Tax=Proteinivorax hydrogeniformans TaxID=1826727 RepID=A0AAU8HXG9_9FIRM